MEPAICTAPAMATAPATAPGTATATAMAPATASAMALVMATVMVMVMAMATATAPVTVTAMATAMAMAKVSAMAPAPATASVSAIEKHKLAVNLLNEINDFLYDSCRKIKKLYNKNMANLNKYGNQRTHYAGKSFMSKGEASCFAFLELLEKYGSIKDLKCQVAVYLTEARLYFVMDFYYFDVARDCLIFADYKGFETDRWRVLKKLWPFYGPAPLVVYKQSGSAKSKRIIITEQIDLFQKVVTHPKEVKV